MNGINGFAVRPGSKSGVDLGTLINGGVLGASSGIGGSGANVVSENATIGLEDEEEGGPEEQLARESKVRRMSVDSRDGTLDAFSGEDKMQH